MSEEIAKLIVAVEAQTAKFARDMDAMERKLKGFAKRQEWAAKRSGEAWGKLGAQLKAFAGAYLGTALFRSIIKSTAEAEQSFALLEVSVKNSGNATKGTAEQYAALAMELQGVSTFSDEAIQDATSLLLKYDDLGVSIEEATKLTVDLAARMKTDLPTAAKLVGKALGDPARALRTLGEAGIVLSKAQRKAITELSETGRRAEASRYLFDELAGSTKGAAAAMRDNFGGALEGLKNDFGNLLEVKTGLPGATQAINDFSAVLRDPDFAAGIDLVFGTMLTLITKIVEGLGLILGLLPKIASIKLPEWMGGQQLKDVELPGPLGAAQSVWKRIFSSQQPAAPTSQAGAGGVEFASGASDGESLLDGLVPSKKELSDVDKAIAKAKEMVAALRAQVETFGASEAGAAAYNVTLGEQAAIFDAAGSVGEELRQEYILRAVALEDLKAATEAQTRAEEEAKKVKEEVAAALEGLKTDYDRASDAVDKYIGWLEKGLITEEQFAALVKQTGDALAEQARQTADAAETMTIQWDQALRNMQDILAETLFNSFEGGVKDMVYQWALALKRMAAEALAANIFGALQAGAKSAGGFWSALFGAFTGAVTVGGGAAAGAAAGGGGGGWGIPGAASGGRFREGQAAIVGERGRELVHFGGFAANGGSFSEGEIVVVGERGRELVNFGGFAASGGNFAGGEWAMVGERGRELVRFDAPATVVPNHITESIVNNWNAAPLAAAAGASVSDFSGFDIPMVSERESERESERDMMHSEMYERVMASHTSDKLVGSKSGAVAGAPISNFMDLDIPMAANGGEFREGEWAMVGERGRELVRFDAPAMVLPHHVTENIVSTGADGSRPISVTFNVETPDAESFMRSQSQIQARMATALTRASSRNN